jgi:hypothetical protein
MPKNKQRKPRGKIRQQIRWAIEDQELWDDDLLTSDSIDFKPEAKDKHEKSNQNRKKGKNRPPTHRDFDIWIDNLS